MSRLETILEKKEGIACILAIYQKDLGNTTKIMLKNGETILLPQSVNAVLKRIANYYALHLRLLRKKQQQLLNVKYYTPLPLHHDLLLFPIKTRIPKIKKDASISYINFYEVQKLDPHQRAIHLKNGAVIHSLNAAVTLRKRYHQGALCCRQQQVENNPPEPIREIPSIPVTREELEAIARELNHIRGLLNGLFLSAKS